MPIVRAAQWAPDAAALGNPGSIDVRNAVPGVTSYKPMPQHTAFTNAIDAYARGAIHTRDEDLNVSQFVGNASKIYELVSATWTDRSIGGGYSTAAEESWEFVRWKNQVLATNWDDSIQFIALGGTIFANLTTDFKCRHLAVIGDFVFAANTTDATDGNVPDRIRWCAFTDETDWTASPITGSDIRDLKGGPILKLFGGEYGVVLGEDTTYRIDFVGAPTWFRIDETIPAIGTIAPGAACQVGNKIYTWSEHGFVVITNGTGFDPIGSGRVDTFLRADLDDSFLYRISSVSDPVAGRVFWAYPGAGNTAGRPNRIAVYDYNLDQWALIEFELDLIWRAGGVGVTLEGLDAFSASLDALSPSMDSSQWKGDGVQLLAAFDSTSAHGFFDGSPMTATIETKEIEIHAGRRTRLNAFTPLVDGGTVTATVGSRSRQTDAVAFTASLTQSATGRFTKRVNARFHRFKLTCSGAWKDAIGVSVEESDAPVAEGRG